MKKLLIIGILFLMLPIKTFAATFSIKTVVATDSSISINWTQVRGAQYYYVYYQVGTDSKFNPFMQNNQKMKLKWYSNFSATLNQLPQNTYVSFKVSAIINNKEIIQPYVLKTKTKQKIVKPLAAIENARSLYLISNDGKHKYLGKLTSNEFDSEGIFNEYSTYGNEYNSDSIWNEFGTYGNEFSSYSVMNEFTSTPPIIVNENGEFIGYLTKNEFKTPAYDPDTILILLKKLGL